MMNLMKLTKAELYKSFKGKSFLIIMAIVVCAIIFMSLIYGVSVEEYKKMFPDNSVETTPQEVVEAIEYNMAKNEEDYNQGKITKRVFVVRDYQMRSELAIANYMIDKDLEYGDFIRYMEESMVLNANAQNMILFVLSSATLIIGIIAAVMAASAISDELNQGTMRLLLMSPINRISLVVAKIIAIMTNIFLVLIAIVIITIIMGYILYPSEMLGLMIVVNATKAALIPFAVGVLLKMFLLLVYSFMIVCIIMALVAVFKSKVFGIIMGVVLCTNLFSTALHYRPSLVSLFSWTILANMDFNVFFNSGGNIYGQLSLPMAILVYIINAIALMGISMLIFLKRDID